VFSYFINVQVREGLRSDPRYNTVRREDREGLFNAYIADLVSAEQEAERAAKAKRDEEVSYKMSLISV
jgi:hypothetical protein